MVQAILELMVFCFSPLSTGVIGNPHYILQKKVVNSGELNKKAPLSLPRPGNLLHLAVEILTPPLTQAPPPGYLTQDPLHAPLVLWH